MTSALGWLDTDENQRKRMLEVVELFKDEGSVDELGVGAIRDTIADALFPGTSVLHRRARYVLFVAWQVRNVARQGLEPRQALEELRRGEIQLIYTLIQSNGIAGVIGGQAKAKLKRMPSSVYWAALRRWEIRLWDATIEGHFRKAKSYADLRRIEPSADDPGVGSSAATTGIDPDLPETPDLTKATTFDLTKDESNYLTDQLVASTKGSLLAWLAPSDRNVDVEWVWGLPYLDQAPDQLAVLIQEGRRFHTAIHGAPLLYNLLLAQKQRDNNDLVDRYEAELASWREELAEADPFEGWDRQHFWTVLRRYNPRVGPRTQSFVDSWLDIVSADALVERREDARALIERRELDLKRGRARLHNSAALDRWNGRSGLVRLDYRWRIAQQLVADLQEGRRTA